MPIFVDPAANAPELAATISVSDDDRLLQAEALVRSYCRWHIAPSRSASVTVRAAGSGTLLLPTLHLTAVASVTDDGTLVDVADYEWTESGVLTRVSGCWTSRPIVVAFTHGFDTVPADVTGVVQAVAQRAVDNPGSKPREQTGPFDDTFSQAGPNQAPALTLLDAEKATLDSYRIPGRP